MGAATSPKGAADVSIRVLGCFDVLQAGEPITLGGPRQQAVLARLLVADGPVRVDQLVEDVWGEIAPPSAAGSLHAYVSRLRRQLGQQFVQRSAGGYHLDAARVQVDSASFERMVADGKRALDSGDLATAVGRLQRAAACWRGDSAFGPRRDMSFLEPEAHRLEELRLAAAEALADARLGLGSAQEDIAPLLDLVTRFPMRESLLLRLVRALNAAGRPADALAAYERCRRLLAAELGIDPSRELQAVHAQILTRVNVATTWWLPPRNRAFSGREAFLRRAEAVLGSSASRPRLLALHGLGGVGKTELALELAHRRRGGHAVTWWIRADGAAALMTGLADLARALEVSHRTRQEDLLAALWEELSRRGSWLIVFDNAEDPNALKSLLPPTGDGDIIVTSRNPAWRRLGVPVAVTPFARGESRRFLSLRSGDPDPAAADELAAAVGDLPLALEHACAYVEQTQIGLGDYLHLLGGRERELLSKEFPDGSRPSVGATWEVSFDRVRQRSPEAAQLLQTIAFLAPEGIPLRVFDPVADELTINERTSELLRFSLIDRQHESLSVHRLVQAVVRARLSPEERRERLGTAIALVVASDPRLGSGGWDDLAPHVLALTAHVAPPWDADPQEAYPQDADPQSMAALAAPLLELIIRCAMWLADRTLFTAALEELRIAVRIARAYRDPVAEGSARSALGEVLDRSGDWAGARTELERAVLLLGQALAHDDARLAHAHNRLGHVLNCAGDAAGAVSAHERAIALFRQVGEEVQLAEALTDLGYTRWGAGDLRAARDAFRESITIHEGRSDPLPSLAHAIAGLGLVEQDSGALAAALDCQARALELFTTLCGPRHPDVAQSWDKLGYVRRLIGDIAGSVEAHERAVSELESVFGSHDPRVAMALTNAGMAYRAAGRHPEAAAAQQRAHELFRSTYGDDHVSTQFTARRLAVALAEVGAAPTGRLLAEQALDRSERTWGDGSVEVARTAADYAIVLAALGEQAAAREQRQRALRILIEAFGPEHHEVMTLARSVTPAPPPAAALDEAVGGLASEPDRSPRPAYPVVR